MEKLIKFLLFVICAILLFSCSADEDNFESNEIFEDFSETTDVKTRALSEDIIIPIKGNRDSLKRPNALNASYEIREEIDQLEDIPFYLQVQGNSTSKQFLNASAAGTEVSVAEYGGNINQQFYIKILPATSGIPYLIYSKKSETPIRLGVYTSNPDVKVLYADYNNTNDLFGASWDFRKGTNTLNSYIIENQDSPEQGSSGNWGDIYYPVITVNDAKVSFAQYNNSPRQEFAIIPVEIFKIEEIRFNIDGSEILENLPEIVFFDGFTNNGPIPQTHNFTLSETYKESSTFNRKTSYNLNISTEIKTKVPFIASGKINTSTSFGQEFTYGTSEEKTFSINRTYTIDVLANYRAEFSLTLSRYNMDVEYVAVCRGLTSGKRINIKGRWAGVDCIESNAVLNHFPIDGRGPSFRTVITPEMLKSNSKIKVK